MSNTIRVSESREPVTRRVHDSPWAADLETAKHAEDRELVVAEALDAVGQTRTGQHVDLITHRAHGHPATYLYPVLESLDDALEITDPGRCDCGGYVSRVSIRRK